MDMKELQQKNDKELVDLVNEKRMSLREIRFKGTGSGMRDTHAIRNSRREIARALTELNRRNKEARGNA